MNERDFTYWLTGFVELHGEVPTATQWKQIKEHLALVFNKVTKIPAPLSSELSLSERVSRQLDARPPATYCSSGGAGGTRFSGSSDVKLC